MSVLLGQAPWQEVLMAEDLLLEADSLYRLLDTADRDVEVISNLLVGRSCLHHAAEFQRLNLWAQHDRVALLRNAPIVSRTSRASAYRPVTGLSVPRSPSSR